jgi:tRNA(Ile)-lysidine synthase
MMRNRDESRPIDPAALFGRFGLLPSTRCALAVSGGSDSTALMVLFADWLRSQGWTIASHVVLTVDHGLRTGSAAEAQVVGALAQRVGFAHATLPWQGPKLQTGVQAAARTARYRLMGNFMQANGMTLLLTGHTRDDQAETLLMRLARGSGVDGLAGMAPRLRFSELGLGNSATDEPEVARPLLDIARSQLRAMLRTRGITWIEDPSNQSLEFERPRWRAARAHLDELGLTDAMLALSATRLLRARRALDRAAAEFCSPDAGAVRVDPCGTITIDRTRLRAAEEETALRVLGRAIAAAGGSGEHVPLAKLEAIAASLRGPGAAPGKWTLARAMISASDAAVVIEREPGRKPPPCLALSAGEEACWDGRFLVSVGTSWGAGTVEVSPLGEAKARDLGRRDVVTTKAPARAVGLVPSFWSAETLLAVPSVGFWADPNACDVLQARFIWTCATNNSSLEKP